MAVSVLMKQLFRRRGFSEYFTVADALDAAVAGQDDEQAKLQAIVALTATAAEEYAEGVVDGKLANLHEYQDAWGFIQTAHSHATRLATSQNAAVVKAAKASLEQIDGLSGSFKGLIPPAGISTDPSDLYVASARIAFAAAAAK